ncbi:hypothetical protein PVAND_002737 [Polypedilum vanderplanki]|uniref:THAP-type domain-containing protein n=1 Tax=Polypedilum vanderplanki TaxID=319348 RepID=A0A9J6BTI5_POLVA|nr:hypothetical protein PVAND_002737 [Polypedilum vanderplanki]
MGGCRCSFFGCQNNTTLAKTNSIHSHFFHFPVKNLKRCIEWAIYSNRMEFLNLPIEKLKNKVICDYHFSENHFMNYTRSKLNKTTAVPTIYINENKEEIDLLQNPTDWISINRSMEVPSQFKNLPVTKIDIDESTEEQQQPPPPKRIKTDSPQSTIVCTSPQQKIRILNKVPVAAIPTPISPTCSNKIITYKQVKTIDPTVMTIRQQPQSTKLPTTGTRLQKITPYQIKSKITETTSNLTSTTIDCSFVENNEEPQETFEYVTVLNEETSPPLSKQQSSSLTSSPLVTSKYMVNEEIKDLIIKTSDDVKELKTLVSTTLSKIPTTSSVKEDNSNITQSGYNKVQLFNGIKRYLPPSLMALVRLELFGGTENREYKNDEKIICGELLSLGEETYNFLNEEWRLRLPSKELVRTWLNEGNPIDDDDAS